MHSIDVNSIKLVAGERNYILEVACKMGGRKVIILKLLFYNEFCDFGDWIEPSGNRNMCPSLP